MTPAISIPLSIATFGLLISLDEFSIDDLMLRSAKRIPDRSKVRARLTELGKTSDDSYFNFRIAQLTYSGIFILLINTFWVVGFLTLASALELQIFGVSATYVITERNLSTRVKARKRKVEAELPMVLEMLTLSIGAGESPAAAFTRLAKRAHGIIADEFKVVIRDIESGINFTSALDRMSSRVEVHTIRRFVDALIISMNRGTPLVQTLSSQAQEARNHERNLILTLASKAEISMMIPVVFLILPISIVFALFPSLTSLQLFAN